LKPAIEFATKQHLTPMLKLQIAELNIAVGNNEKAADELKTLSAIGGDIGFQATERLSELYIDQKKYNKAKEIIQGNPKFSESVRGQEHLARIALYLKELKTADQIYQSIEKSSPEARSFLAKKAYQEKNWRKARQLTEQLIRDYPDNEQLRENLKKITLQEQK
jgi:tetratricopeptide (TPR) repeat protein